METKFFLGGLGGQGVVVGGRMLGAAAAAFDMGATAYAEYAPAMRNGWTYSTVIISTEPVVDCAVSDTFDCMVFFDEDSCVKNSDKLNPGGIYVINRSLCTSDPADASARVIEVRANEIAEELGNEKYLNVIMLGAVIQATGVFDLEYMRQQIRETFASKPAVAEANIKALERGADAAR